MRNLAVIYNAGISPQARGETFGGKTAQDRVLAWARELPDIEKTLVFRTPGEDLFPGIPSIIRDSWDETALLSALAEAADGFDNLFYVWGDCPFLDGTLSKKLHELHYKYFAEYTFADGYPYGFTPEILASGVPARLLPLAGGSRKPVARDSLFEILRKDINAFDVETEISPVDLRMERISFTCDTRRNVSIMHRLEKAGGSTAQEFLEIIPQNRHLLRDLPAYFPIQVTDRCPQSCSYCPFPLWGGDPRENQGFMDKAVFADLCRRIVDFAGDAVISPSLWGEPALHPEIETLITSALEAGDTRVLIETSGIGWDQKVLRSLAEKVPLGRLLWIVSLDAPEETLYRSLRGEGLAEAEGTADLLQELFGSSLWVQAVRMKENEEHLESFHKKWTSRGCQVLIQKYSSAGGALPLRQPVDLSPLKRFPCWHIKRDFPILLNGDVPFCREAGPGEKPLGNVERESLEEIWAAGAPLHKDHVKGNYPGVCEHCDEYYTFNF